MQTASPTPPTPDRRESPTLGEMLWEVADLAGGVVITLLPLLLLAVPGVILFLPALVLLAVAAVPLMVAGAILVSTYLLTRSVLRALGARRKTHRRSTGGRAPAALGRVAGATPRRASLADCHARRSYLVSEGE
jgi:hypothetical protein